jgi:CRP-like cAMP-binding protein
MLDVLLRYVQFLMTQTAQTAYANASFGVESRLARWILMTHDRLKRDDLPLTHEFMSMMLGTRRSSVTTATHVLEGNGLIRATRGVITVRDREKLEELAGDAYGLAEAEYERLFGAT